MIYQEYSTDHKIYWVQKKTKETERIHLLYESHDKSLLFATPRSRTTAIMKHD